MNRRKLLLSAVGVILVLGLTVVFWLAGHEAKVPEAMAPSAATTVVVAIEPVGDVAARSAQVTYTDRMTAFDALASSGIVFAAKNYGDLGLLVESIEGVKNNTDGKYWFYYVNGVSPTVGASTYNVVAGDTITWKFETPK